MIVLGFVLVALAVAAVAVLVVQNRNDVVNVHALGQTWSVHLYWLLVLGLIIAAVALIGLSMMKAGGARARRLRRERKSLSIENKRLSQRLEADRDVTAPTTTVAPVPSVTPMPSEAAVPSVMGSADSSPRGWSGE
jgi:hypothetical protein